MLSKWKYFVVIIPGFFFILSASYAQEGRSYPYLGKLIGVTDKKPVPFAFVLNKNTHRNTLCDSLGFFSIEVNNGDTLVFSRVGYYQRDMIARSMGAMSHIIELTERVYALNEVKMLNFGTYEEFKYDVIHATPLKEPFMNPMVMYGFPKRVIVLQPQMSIPLGHPITALYMLLSKEGKALRKLSELKEVESRQFAYKDKYSPAVVSQLTGLKDLELEKFMKYCNMDESFIEASNMYEVAEKVLDYFKKYKVEQDVQPALPTAIPTAIPTAAP